MSTVSVIMPCFNHARFLPDAVRGVLGQTHADLELIITDDCSKDNSWEVMKEFANADSRVKLVKHEKNGGLPKSRNDGMRISKGEYLAFCDSDDVWEPEKLRTQVELLKRNPDHDMTYCDTWIIDENGSLTGQRFSEIYPLPRTASGFLFAELVSTNFINVQSAVIRRKCLRSVERFDEDLRVLEDWWYWVQLSRHHQFLYSPEPLARYRVHCQSSNVVKKRSFCVTRLKIFSRILQKYDDLTPRTIADIHYQMGADLCALGKRRSARPFLWNAVKLSLKEARAFRCCKAVARIGFPTAVIRA